ncbi:SGNH/GDSL hydrolase family protein [Spirosoma aureum]|uniref:SGNH/GDSL hydrolase family protein n=1 Tax=Spirosoma aureum TaxID=2692134 RepID=A0A6G9AYW4_9BACT|nr:SGNH/GDSL hydrolase family protein [Spirosoma aureum]QIP17556.1 SGNH/GDSL hydrolase family protein [Spirosoma aureum]
MQTILTDELPALNKDLLRISRQKKAFTFWGLIILITLSLLLICYVYDNFITNGDGLVANFAYKNIAKLSIIVTLIGFFLHLMLLARHKLIQNLSLTLLSALFFLMLLETIGHIVLGLQLVKSSPFVFRRFYVSPGVIAIRPFPAGDLNPIAGRSHLPNGNDRFVNCEGDSIQRSYNSVGAMDRERSLTNLYPQRKRVAIVGDSFMEGYLVNEPYRFSSILERETGAEHLNFAVNGSNPVHYFLMYKGVVKQFDHDIVIVGFLPANDFEILDERQDYTRVDWPSYVPYWHGKAPDYTLKYSLANTSQALSSGHQTNSKVLKVVDSLYSSLSFGNKLKADLLAHSSLFRLLGEANAKSFQSGQMTRYQSFNEEQWQYVRQSLTQLIKEAKGKQVLILSLPTLADLSALKQGAENRIDPLLSDFCRTNGATFISLAPAFLTYKGALASLYISCDGHWSKQGEAFAADFVLHHPAYRNLLTMP